MLGAAEIYIFLWIYLLQQRKKTGSGKPHAAQTSFLFSERRLTGVANRLPLRPLWLKTNLWEELTHQSQPKGGEACRSALEWPLTDPQNVLTIPLTSTQTWSICSKYYALTS